MTATAYWTSEHWNSPDRVTRHVAFTTVFLVAITFLYALLGGMDCAPLCNLWAMLLVVSTWFNCYVDEKKASWSEWTRLPIYVLLAASVPVYFDGANKVNRIRADLVGEANFINDQSLLMMDEALLGFIFPKGQISLWLDPYTYNYFVIFCTEILQTLYASYYIWGNGMGLYLAFQYFKLVYRESKQLPSQTLNEQKRLAWRRVQIFLQAWVFTYLLNFLGNLAVPAVSPRIYIAKDYHNEVRGIYIANIIRGAIKNAASNTYSAFPSGHCGLSWMAAIIATRLQLTRYAPACSVAAVLITLATLTLRYHYFVDMLFAIPMCAAGVYFAGIQSAPRTNTLISGRTPVEENGVSYV